MESLPQSHSGNDVSRGAPLPHCEVDLPGFRPIEAANDTRMLQLARTIELEIIPRLMLAHLQSAETPVRAIQVATTIGPDDVSQFARIVLSQDEDSALASIATLRARGVAVEQIFVGLLAPTARYLGELWNEDLCNFTDVTVGLGRLQRVLRELSPALGCSVEHPSRGRRVLLVPSPGEQHTFGLVMVSEFFRQAGWDVSGGAWFDGTDAASQMAGEWFDAIGFSLGAEVHLPQLAASIAAVRAAASNRDIVVLVGGPLFGLHPEFAERVGADGMTIDGREAPALTEALIVGKSCQQMLTRR